MKEYPNKLLKTLFYQDSLRKDKYFNDLVIETLENGDLKKALEYLKKDNERIEKALEE